VLATKVFLFDTAVVRIRPALGGGNEKTAKRISGFSRIVDFPIGIELDGSKIG
jgi:hypothetical protein